MSDSAILALEQAIKFESDGHDFYLRAADTVADPLAKAIFLALAEDEKDHISRVREIYEELKEKPGWPDELAMVAASARVMDVFERESIKMEIALETTTKEAIEKAISMEKEGIAFYRERAAQATCGGEKEFFDALVREEIIHLAALEKALT